MNIVIPNSGNVSSRFWDAAIKASENFDIARALEVVRACHPLAKDADDQAVLLYAYDLCFEEVREMLGIRSDDIALCRAEMMENIVDEYPKLKDKAVSLERTLQEQLAVLKNSANGLLTEVYRLRAEHIFNLRDTIVDQAQAAYDGVLGEVTHLENVLRVSSLSAFERHYAAELDAAKQALKDKFEFVEMLNDWKAEVVQYVRNSSSANNDATEALTKTKVVKVHFEIR